MSWVIDSVGNVLVSGSFIVLVQLWPLGAQKAGMLDEAQDAWLAAVALDSSFAPAFTGLGHLEGARGNIQRVSETGQASMCVRASSLQTLWPAETMRCREKKTQFAKPTRFQSTRESQGRSHA